ncbi:MAG: hypothetical protein QE487_14550 [Fluviicola sp.]|nr:hypothetical protein [Fluviicola sp.]
MKPLTKKSISAKSKLLLAMITLAAVGVTIGIIYWSSTREPSWKYMQSFQQNNCLTSVDKVSKSYKGTQEDFFLIHTFDFATKTYKEVIKIQIEDNMAYQSEYKGYSDRYIWLTTPQWTAVDMRSADHTILDFTTLKKKICGKNPQQFKDVIELAKVEGYLKATNQNGDVFFVNLETFATSQTAPKPFYDVYHKDYSILDQLPSFLTGSRFSENYNCVATVNKTDYILKPIDPTNSIKRSFFSSPNLGDPQISVTVTDSTQAVIQNGTVITSVPQTPTVEQQETRLTNRSFINAIGIGVSNNRFVFHYQKSVDRTAPWYLAWFDLTTKSLVKEVNLASKGMVIETPMEEISHTVSLDGKWVFFMIATKKPIRIKL